MVVVDVLLEEGEAVIVAELKELLDCLADIVSENERSGEEEPREPLIVADAEFVEDSVP